VGKGKRTRKKGKRTILFPLKISSFLQRLMKLVEEGGLVTLLLDFR
jgi:hypothetical protein